MVANSHLLIVHYKYTELAKICIKQQWEWAGTCYFFPPSKEFDLVEVEIVRLHC